MNLICVNNNRLMNSKIENIRGQIRLINKQELGKARLCVIIRIIEGQNLR